MRRKNGGVHAKTTFVCGLLFILILGAEYDGSMSRNLYQVVSYYSFNE